MSTEDADELMSFQDVMVIRSTAPALLCRIGGRSVWLPRGHISGKLWNTGDRGRLFIRRWVARDRHLIDLHGAAISSVVPFIAPSPLAARLHVVRAHHAK